jgi:hypothetical protein
MKAAGYPEPPKEGEFLLSDKLAKIYWKQRQNGFPDHELKALFDSFGSKYLGVLPPHVFTESPDDLVVIQHLDSEYKAKIDKSAEAILKMNEEAEGSSSYLSDDGNGWRFYKLEANPDFGLTSAAVAILNALKIVGALALVFPILLLISIAAGLGAKQKEARYSAMRLIGATRKQVTNLIVLESLIGVVIGIVLGYIMFIPVRLLIVHNFTLSGLHFWSSDLQPTLSQCGIVTICVILFGLFINLRNMYKVQISPLGVVRKQKLQKNPRIWRIIPLAIGLLILVAMVVISDDSGLSAKLFILGFVVLMLAQLIAGPYLTFVFSRLVAKRTENAEVLLATKRLSVMPKVIFRSVSGLMMAMFVTGFLTTLVAAVRRMQDDVSIEIIELTHIVYLGIGLTVLITVASMVISTLGGLLERKDSLLSLHLSGMTGKQMRHVIIVESLIPMLATTILSAVLGMFAAVAIEVGSKTSSSTASALTNPFPSWSFLVIIVSTIIVATLAIYAILPTVKQLVSVEGNRKE